MLIKVRVFPSSKKEEVIQKSSDSFEVKVKEKPIEGRANQAVVSALASFLKIPENKVRLVRGFKTRNKIFKIHPAPHTKEESEVLRGAG
jgi:uncharacterized protein (TIGR00251 family)